MAICRPLVFDTIEQAKTSCGCFVITLAGRSSRRGFTILIPIMRRLRKLPGWRPVYLTQGYSLIRFGVGCFPIHRTHHNGRLPDGASVSVNTFRPNELPSTVTDPNTQV